jgi:DNA-binding MarR family transcriptional regulator
MPGRDYEEKHLVEDISLCFEQVGLSRMAGRILGVLLIADPPQQSITDLCQGLHASKSAISTSTRLLSEMGLIERVPSPLPRQVYFRFKPGGWITLVRMHLRLMASLHQIAEQGLGLLEGEPAALRDRLQEAHDVLSLMNRDCRAFSAAPRKSARFAEGGQRCWAGCRPRSSWQRGPSCWGCTQRLAEEQLLWTLAPAAYKQYRQQVGMFVVRLGALLRRSSGGGLYS